MMILKVRLVLIRDLADRLTQEKRSGIHKQSQARVTHLERHPKWLVKGGY